jgi:hypothetical protein
MAAKSSTSRPEAAPVPSGCCLLPVHGGTFTLVDQSTVEMLRRMGNPHLYLLGGYVVAGSRPPLALHRLVVNARRGDEVHHVNGDKGDNRLANLQTLLRAEHLWVEPRRLARPERGVAPVLQPGYGGRLVAVVYWQRHRVWRYAFCSTLLSAFMRDDLARALTGRNDGLNFSKSIEQRDIRPLFEANRDEPIGVTFVRRGDGAIRQMRCRLPVRATQASPPPFDPARRRLLAVFDLDRREHRFIPLENVLCLTLRNERIRVLRRAAFRPRSTSTAT